MLGLLVYFCPVKHWQFTHTTLVKSFKTFKLQWQKSWTRLIDVVLISLLTRSALPRVPAWQTLPSVPCKRRARILGAGEWRLRRAPSRCGKLKLMASRAVWTDESESRLARLKPRAIWSAHGALLMEPGRLPAGALAGTHLAWARIRPSLTLTEMSLTFCQFRLNEATGGAGVVFRVFSPGFCLLLVQLKWGNRILLIC